MNAIIIFTKYPREGKVKTRLSRTLGDKFASTFFKAMTENIFNVCLSLSLEDFSLFLFYDDIENKELIKEWVPDRFILQQQEGKDLGEKMMNAFRFLFERGFKKVIIIGTDIPDINTEILLKSFDELSRTNVAIGPSTDGGYYLLGLDNFYHFLFNNIEWSSENVFNETIRRIRKNKLSFYLLPKLIDIDTEADLTKWISKSNGDNEMIKLINEYGLGK